MYLFFLINPFLCLFAQVWQAPRSTSIQVTLSPALGAWCHRCFVNLCLTPKPVPLSTAW